MSKTIPSSGKLGVGSTAGVNRSINLLKNLKSSTSASQPNSSLNALRSWFRTNVGSQGAVDGQLANSDNTTLNISQWRGVFIYGMIIKVKNEAMRGTYTDGNNGKVYMQGVYGDQVNYKFKFNGSTKTVNYGAAAEFTNINVSGTAGGSKDFTNCTMTHRSQAFSTETFSIRMFLVSGSTPSPIVLGFGTNNQNISLGANNGTKYTTAKTLLIGTQS